MSSKKAIDPEVKKAVVAEIVTDYKISITPGMQVISIHRSYFYYAEKKDDNEVIDSIRRGSLRVWMDSGKSIQDYVRGRQKMES